MIEKNILYFIVALFFFSCSENKIEKAYKDKDAEFFLNYVNDLSEIESKNFNDFINDLMEMQQEVDFGYGYLDYERNWKDVPDSTKSILIHNITEVYKLYFNSCLFQEIVNHNELKYIQEKYFDWDRKFDKNDLRIIQVEIERGCRD